MTALATFLMAITGSIAARVLTSLGIGIFSYSAFTTVINTVITNVTTNYNGMPSFALNIVNLAGGGQCMGILFAALTVRASLMAIKTMRPT